MLPTLLTACGVAVPRDVDGSDVMATLAGSKPVTERDLFWELGEQTAIRRGPWKLTIKPREVESALPVADVFLANLDDDRSESVNLAAVQPQLTAELKARAESWRADLEQHWKGEFLAGKAHGVTALTT